MSAEGFIECRANFAHALVNDPKRDEQKILTALTVFVRQTLTELSDQFVETDRDLAAKLADLACDWPPLND